MRNPLASSLLCLLAAFASPLPAQRINWGFLPGSEDHSFCGICWDHRRGRILTADADRVGSLDPLTGRFQILATVAWKPEIHAEAEADQD